MTKKKGNSKQARSFGPKEAQALRDLRQLQKDLRSAGRKKRRERTAMKIIRGLPLDPSDEPLTGEEVGDILDQRILDQHPGLTKERLEKMMRSA